MPALYPLKSRPLVSSFTQVNPCSKKQSYVTLDKSLVITRDINYWSSCLFYIFPIAPHVCAFLPMLMSVLYSRQKQVYASLVHATLDTLVSVQKNGCFTSTQTQGHKYASRMCAPLHLTSMPVLYVSKCKNSMSATLWTFYNSIIFFQHTPLAFDLLPFCLL